MIGSQFPIAGVHPVIAPYSIALAFGAALLTGLFFGTYPARSRGGDAPNPGAALRMNDPPSRKEPNEHRPIPSRNPGLESRAGTLRAARPRRRQFFNRKSAALAAAITCAAGFYAGISVEKGQLASTASAAASPRTATGGPAAAGAGGFAGRFGAGGAAGAGGNASIGTVSSVHGKTIYLTDTTGNTVKVTLSSATKITKSQSVSKASVRPGDAVVIQGLKGSNGKITATSVSDSGASANRGGSSATGSAASGTNTTSTGTAG